MEEEVSSLLPRSEGRVIQRSVDRVGKFCGGINASVLSQCPHTFKIRTSAHQKSAHQSVYSHMPFTFAHPAVVLPFGKFTKRWLSTTGLVIGSLVPDFEYFFRMRLLSRYSHTWEGLVWFDIPLAYILTILYEIYIKDKLITHLPAAPNRRLFWFKGFRTYYSFGYFMAILFAVSIGAVSHLVWDGFTHPKGMFVHDFPVLQRIITVYGHRVYVFHFLQFASTAAGALVIAFIYYTLPKGELTRVKNISAFWLQVTLVIVVVFVIKLAAGMSLQQHGDVLITVIDGTLLGLVVACTLGE